MLRPALRYASSKSPSHSPFNNYHVHYKLTHFLIPLLHPHPQQPCAAHPSTLPPVHSPPLNVSKALPLIYP